MNSVSPRRSRKVVKIETIAIPIGTIARKDAKTKLSTISAPKPPSTASSSTPGPSPPPPLSSASASKPVSLTGAPPTVRPRPPCSPPRKPPGSRRTARPDRAAGRRARRWCARRRRRRSDHRSRHRRRSAPAAAPPSEPGVDLCEVGLHRGGVDGLALGERDHGDEWRGVAAGALVLLGDRDVGLPALLLGDRELLVERLGGRACGHDPGDRERRSSRSRRCACGARTQRVRRGQGVPPGWCW